MNSADRSGLVPVDESDLEVFHGPDGPDVITPHPLPTFAPKSSIPDNAFALALPMWGPRRARWARWLAQDVFAWYPLGDIGRQRRGWVAGILVSAAVEENMQRTDDLWDHVMTDITTMTEVTSVLAMRRWRELLRAELTQPSEQPY